MMILGHQNRTRMNLGFRERRGPSDKCKKQMAYSLWRRLRLPEKCGNPGKNEKSQKGRVIW